MLFRMRALFDLLRRRPGFRWLWIGETISLVGDWLSYVAVSLLALSAGEGAFALAVVFAAHLMPTALVAPVAGILADRVDKRRILIGTQILMAILMVAMVFAASAGSLVLVQILLFLRTTVAGFFYPAKQAALRDVVAEEELLDANAIDATTWSVTFTIGTALGGVIAMAGPVTALIVDTATFVIAAIVLARVPALPSEAAPTKRPSLGDMMDAVREARRHDGLLEAVFTKAPLAVAGGGAWVLLNLTADQTRLWGSAALALGLLQAARGVGTGVGPLFAKRFVTDERSPGHMLRASAWFSLATIALFTAARPRWISASSSSRSPGFYGAWGAVATGSSAPPRCRRRALPDSSGVCPPPTCSPSCLGKDWRRWQPALSWTRWVFRRQPVGLDWGAAPCST